MSLLRNSHQRCFIKKDILRNFTKFTEKHLCQSLFFNKVADLRPLACNFIKKETLAQVLSCEFCEISKNNFFAEHLWTTASIESDSEKQSSRGLPQPRPATLLNKRLCHKCFSVNFVKFLRTHSFIEHSYG